jgi:ribokinase
VKIAVIGHAEHVTLARVPVLPLPGDIAHLDGPVVIAGGGGALAFHQLVKSDAEVHFFTAIGVDDAALHVYNEIADTSATIHAALRMEPHTRDVVLVTPDGERTILVVGRPLHPQIDDILSWDILSECDACYFTGDDPETLRRARNAKFLAVTARRRHVLDEAGVRADVVIGSGRDPRERSRLADYAVSPGALVMTEGKNGGAVETADGIMRFASHSFDGVVVSAYGAGDTFAAALTWYLAAGLPIGQATSSAARHAAAVMTGINPVESQQFLTADG